MPFVQIIDCRTSRYDEIADLDNDWEKATEGRRTLRRQITTRDRNDADHYEIFCFFDSYEDAVANSNLPETTAGAARYAELLDSPPRFVDLDVLEDQTLDEVAAAKPGFLQIIELRTPRAEDMRALDREYSAAVADRTTVRRAVVTQDRADREHFYVLVFFDSHASAMENSQLPETGAMAAKMGDVLAGPPTFHDLDVIADRAL